MGATGSGLWGARDCGAWGSEIGLLFLSLYDGFMVYWYDDDNDDDDDDGYDVEWAL